MASTGDVRDILEWDVDGSSMPPGASTDSGQGVSKQGIIDAADKKKKPKKIVEPTFKRPEGMHREVYALLYSDNKDPPPLIQTTNSNNQGYKQQKAKLGRNHVRPWKWMPFSNPARKDGAVFHHWRRAADEGKDYPFARFSKSVQVPVYTTQEYQMHLHDDKWTKSATDHLFELCSRLDLRWVVIHDRFDASSFGKRTIEEMKERYYNLINKLSKVRADPNLSGRTPIVFDGEHERKRKEQLTRLFSRTPEQVEEEEALITELKKIELRKKEREKKAQDLQKLITAADNNAELRRTERQIKKKKITLPQTKRKDIDCAKLPETGGIKFPDFKQSGVYLRSQKMKLPSSVGLKKMKAIEHLLDELGIPIQPMPTDDISTLYNELRSDMVLLYELKLAHANCEFELQTLRHRYEALAPGKLPSASVLQVSPASSSAAVAAASPAPPSATQASISSPAMTSSLTLSSASAVAISSLSISSPSVGVASDIAMETNEDDGTAESASAKARKMTEIIDVVTTSPTTPQRKRKTALEQATLFKKIKKL